MAVPPAWKYSDTGDPDSLKPMKPSIVKGIDLVIFFVNKTGIDINRQTLVNRQATEDFDAPCERLTEYIRKGDRVENDKELELDGNHDEPDEFALQKERVTKAGDDEQATGKDLDAEGVGGDQSNTSYQFEGLDTFLADKLTSHWDFTIWVLPQQRKQTTMYSWSRLTKYNEEADKLTDVPGGDGTRESMMGDWLDRDSVKKDGKARLYVEVHIHAKAGEKELLKRVKGLGGG